MNTTNFTTLIYKSPNRKMYHTGAVTSPKSPRDVDVRLDTADDLDDIKNNSIKLED